MKKRKRKTVKKFIFFVFIFIIIAVLLLGYLKRDFFLNIIYKTQNKENIITEICKDIDFECETVDIDSNGDIVKIDYITPGLDDYLLKTVIYSLKSSKVLFKNDFGTADFSSGILNNGFYVAKSSSKTVDIFDANGKKLKTVKIPTENIISNIAVDLAAENICYSQIDSASIYLYNIASNTNKKMCDYSDYLSYNGYDANTFYFANTSNGYLSINTLTEKTVKKTFDNSLRILSPYGCLIQNDTEYEIYKGEKTLGNLVTNKIDEIAIEMSPDRLFTVASDEKGDILTVYSFNSNKFAEQSFDKPIYKVCDLQNGYVAVATKTQNNTPSIYLLNLNLLDWNTSNSEIEQTPKDTANSVSSEDIKTKSKILQNVPVISQFPDFPTGCESVSAVIAMRYAGSDITVDKFVDEYLPKSSEFYFENGNKYGPDPYLTFIGSPKSSNSYGCMAPVIESAMKSYYGNQKNVFNLTGTSLEELCADYIDNGIPCLTWVSINMIEPYYSRNWTLPNGENFRWLANEHCMVLIGYDDDNYYFSDPYNASVVSYGKSLCEQRYKSFGNQAIAITD